MGSNEAHALAIDVTVAAGLCWSSVNPLVFEGASPEKMHCERRSHDVCRNSQLVRKVSLKHVQVRIRLGRVQCCHQSSTTPQDTGTSTS